MIALISSPRGNIMISCASVRRGLPKPHVYLKPHRRDRLRSRRSLRRDSRDNGSPPELEAMAQETVLTGISYDSYN